MHSIICQRTSLVKIKQISRTWPEISSKKSKALSLSCESVIHENRSYVYSSISQSSLPSLCHPSFITKSFIQLCFLFLLNEFLIWLSGFCQRLDISNLFSVLTQAIAKKNSKRSFISHRAKTKPWYG